MEVVPADELFETLPYSITHICFDVSDVLVSKDMKRLFLQLSKEQKGYDSYTPPRWYTQLVSRLKAKYSLGILSNTSVPELYRHFMRFDEYFDVQVYALHSGVPKPLPDAFMHYMEVVNQHIGKVGAGEILYIDDKSANLAVAKSLGMLTALIRLPEKVVTVVHKPYIDFVIEDWFLYR